jgi:16S rRNA (uracil1498-N3)-methyltransferase
VPQYDFRTPRIWVNAPLATDASPVLTAAQGHYLRNVLRLSVGDPVLVFNGRDGEWLGRLAGAKKNASVALMERTRGQTAPGDLHYLFSPLKHARLDYVVQKAVEMGVSRLQPALMRHTQVARVNIERMRANVIEAAEQCGVLNLPEVAEPAPLPELIARFDAERSLVFCDENAEGDPVAALGALRNGLPAPLAVLIGPEGGFSADERAALLKLPRVVRLALGPRILRADTAAVAALALVQAVLGDWTQ